MLPDGHIVGRRAAAARAATAFPVDAVDGTYGDADEAVNKERRFRRDSSRWKVLIPCLVLVILLPGAVYVHLHLHTTAAPGLTEVSLAGAPLSHQPDPPKRPPMNSLASDLSSTTVQHTHPAQQQQHLGDGKGGSSNEPSPVLGRLRSASSVALDINSTLSAHFGLSEGSSPEPTAAQVKELRQTFRGRKFLFPLLDQGPNNQFLQFRVAIAKARQMNRTLVLPIWLPHNPKFQHFHPGAPAVPSRDKWLDQVWYPFDVAMDAAATAQYVRVVPLHVFRALASGALGVCVAPHHSGFESYLRLSRLRCSSFSSDAAQVRSAQKTRFLGYHSYDRDLGTRDKYFGFSRPSRAVVQHASALSRRLFGGDGYIAAHVRVADGHWERSDCKHTINGAAVNSVSCGDKLKAINHSSIAAELVHVWKSVNAEASSLKVRHVFLATNMNCSDTRVAIISDLLQALQVQLVCAQQELSSRVASDNFVASLVEQDICVRAHTFVGSKYSTWTDTVLGFRAHASERPAYTFEELWAKGVR